MSEPLIRAERLRLSLPDAAFGGGLSARRRVPILRGVDFTVHRGETVALVGESGSGKTTLGRCLIRLLEPTGGRIVFDGRDITRLGPEALRPLRPRMQMIFQDPLSALNPRRRVLDSLTAPLRLLWPHAPKGDLYDEAAALLESVGMAPEFLERYPHELSGGQRQRVCIARALATSPDFVMADEIVSGLDVSTQAQILALLKRLAVERNLAVAFITHDLSVVRQVCDRVYVMQAGRIVEQGETAALFEAPREAYTRELIEAIPLPEPDPAWLGEPEAPPAATSAAPAAPELQEDAMHIKDSVALVTGANRGVGACFVRALAARGARKIYACARDLSALPDFDGPAEIIPLRLDVTNPAEVAAAAKIAKDVTLLVNNAGVNRSAPLAGAASLADARLEMETNYFGLLAVSRAFGPVLAANGGGGMIAMLSILARVSLPAMGSLSASKAAAYNAVQALRAEWRETRVLAVLPGAIDTEMSRDFPGEKIPPMTVANEALDAFEAGEWEIYPGEMARQIAQGLKADPLAVQKQMLDQVAPAKSAGMAKNTGAYEKITARDGGTFEAYVCRPEKGSGPALVLLQEIFGINDYMRSMAEHFAEEGYVAIVPDLFWRLQPRVDLGYSDADFGKAFDLYQKFDVDQALLDIQDVITAARRMDGVKGKVGTIGYCLGGLLAWLAAARTDVDVSVGYYAVGLENHLSAADAVRVPMVLHFAGEDKFCPPEAREKILAALNDRSHIQTYVYEGQDHAFATPGRDHFDKPATMMAYSRSLAALRRVLGPIYDLEHLWDMHCYHEFATRDVNATMATMVAEPYVNHIPTMTGGVGHDHLKRFYKYHFVDSNPEDTKLIPISRTIGADRLVDEMIFCFTHDREIDWMLPGVAPTGEYVEVPLVAIVNFRGDKLYHEHIYWDQASVLVQIGKLDPAGLPVAGGETARKLLDETRPSNGLMKKAWATSEGKPL